MSKTLAFKTFCLEQYKAAHGLTGKEALNRFSDYNVFQYITDFYDVLHSTGANYIVQDIDAYIAARSNCIS